MEQEASFSGVVVPHGIEEHFFIRLCDNKNKKIGTQDEPNFQSGLWPLTSY
jgi:hypothetical protein